jgi:hypothetical protein
LQTGSPLFCVYLFENVNLRRLVDCQALEPRVLFFECSQPLGLADFHPSDFLFHAWLVAILILCAAQTDLHWAPGLCLAQYPDNLFLAESTLLHLLLFLEQNPQLCHVRLFGIRPNAHHILGAVCGDASGQVHCFILTVPSSRIFTPSASRFSAAYERDRPRRSSKSLIRFPVSS